MCVCVYVCVRARARVCAYLSIARRHVCRLAHFIDPSARTPRGRSALVPSSHRPAPSRKWSGASRALCMYIGRSRLSCECDGHTARGKETARCVIYTKYVYKFEALNVCVCARARTRRGLPCACTDRRWPPRAPARFHRRAGQRASLSSPHGDEGGGKSGRAFVAELRLGLHSRSNVTRIRASRSYGRIPST